MTEDNLLKALADTTAEVVKLRAENKVLVARIKELEHERFLDKAEVIKRRRQIQRLEEKYDI